MKDDKPPTGHVWTQSFQMRHTAGTQCDILWLRKMAGKLSADCKATRIRGTETLQRRFCSSSLLDYHDDFPTFMASVDKPSWVFLVLSLRSTDISQAVGEPGRQNSCEFAFGCVLARGFASGGTAIPICWFADGKTFCRVLRPNYDYHYVKYVDTVRLKTKNYQCSE
jgi:hypothetical protein